MFRLIAIIAFCTLCLIPIAGFASRIISNEVLHIAFTFGFGYVILPAMLLHLWPTPKSKAEQSMEEALESGNLATTVYSTVAVAELAELEDEGRQFLVEIDGGRTLCLIGQHLYGPVERKLFPCTQFRAFANRVTGRIYGVEPAGPPIHSWPVHSEFSQSTEALIDGQIYDKTIVQLVGHLGGKEAVRSP